MSEEQEKLSLQDLLRDVGRERGYYLDYASYLDIVRSLHQMSLGGTRTAPVMKIPVSSGTQPWTLSVLRMIPKLRGISLITEPSAIEVPLISGNELEISQVLMDLKKEAQDYREVYDSEYRKIDFKKILESETFSAPSYKHREQKLRHTANIMASVVIEERCIAGTYRHSAYFLVHKPEHAYQEMNTFFSSDPKLKNIVWVRDLTYPDKCLYRTNNEDLSVFQRVLLWSLIVQAKEYLKNKYGEEEEMKEQVPEKTPKTVEEKTSVDPNLMEPMSSLRKLEDQFELILKGQDKATTQSRVNTENLKSDLRVDLSGLDERIGNILKNTAPLDWYDKRTSDLKKIHEQLNSIKDMTDNTVCDADLSTRLDNLKKDLTTVMDTQVTRANNKTEGMVSGAVGVLKEDIKRLDDSRARDKEKVLASIKNNAEMVQESLASTQTYIDEEMIRHRRAIENQLFEISKKLGEWGDPEDRSTHEIVSDLVEPRFEEVNERLRQIHLKLDEGIKVEVGTPVKQEKLKRDWGWPKSGKLSGTAVGVLTAIFVILTGVVSFVNDFSVARTFDLTPTQSVTSERTASVIAVCFFSSLIGTLLFSYLHNIGCLMAWPFKKLKQGFVAVWNKTARPWKSRGYFKPQEREYGHTDLSWIEVVLNVVAVATVSISGLESYIQQWEHFSNPASNWSLTSKIQFFWANLALVVYALYFFVWLIPRNKFKTPGDE